METSYAYDIKGQLIELTHRDQEGILDRYIYGYDLMGNKTSIEKQRRGLPEESGAYAYRYDAMGRLAGVSKDGQLLRTCEYDAFGNRSLLKEGNRETAYAYNAMNQLIKKTDVMNEEAYAYDKRGNLSLILKNGDIKDRYLYGALNRLEQAVNGNGEAAAYTYNGLGYRVGKVTGAMEGTAWMQDKVSAAILKGTDVTDPLSRLKEQTIRPETRIEYTIDLTRQYHNLLQKEERGNTQSYLWDGNVAGIREDRGTASHYYLQDELGSPIRLMDRNGELAESYGYDEFGRDLYGNQGIMQPFGYTGYQADRITGTYYAQAREYMPLNGRFVSKDKDRFYKIAVPSSWNLYVYCASNSLRFIDPQGHEGREGREGIDTLTDYATSEWDKFGLQIGLHWLYGNGEDMNISSDSTVIFGQNEWQTYMQDNAILTGKVGDVVIPIGESLDNGESVEVDMNMSMVIDNGEDAVGYQFLHGTDATVGGFQISGSISKDNKGNTTYDLTYTWNDIMNPNFNYSTDAEKANAAQSIPGANPTDYNFHLSWHDRTIIRNNPNFFSRNSGWLKDYSSDWQDYLSEKDMKMLEIINGQQVYYGALTWFDQLQEIYEMYSFYYDCEVLD